MKKTIIYILFLFSVASTVSAADMDLMWSQKYDSILSGNCGFPIYCDVAYSVATDNTGAYFGGQGADNIQRRDLLTGNIVWSTNTYPSSLRMTVRSLGVNSTGVYVGGMDLETSPVVAWQWRIQKVDKNNGSLLWSQDIPTYTDNNSDMVGRVCMTESAMYIVGSDGEGLASSWRIEKRSLADGSLIWRQTEGAGYWYAVAKDCGISADGNSLYIAGIWPAGGYYQWRTEKRDTGSGALVWSDTGSNAYYYNMANAITVDNTGVYIGGFRATSGDGSGGIGTGNMKIEKRNLLDGSLIWSTERTASDWWGGYLGLKTDGVLLYGVRFVSSVGDLLFEKIDSLNGNSLSSNNLVSSILTGAGTVTYFPSWSLFDGSFYFAGSGKTTTVTTPVCTVFCFLRPQPVTTIAQFWAMEKRVGTPVCVANQNQPCSSSANSCGIANTGTIMCDGSCSVTAAPANPIGYGSNCNSAPNACGTKDTGTIQCDGSCSVTAAPANPNGYNSICYSATSNACSMRGVSTLKCDGTCDAAPPPDSICPVDGACGAAASPQSSKPNGPTLCAKGSPSQVLPTSGNGPWAWSCEGTNLGTTASCSAPYLNASGATCPNAICESSKGETPLTCPRDCKVKYKSF